jgi:hypothetical protein
VIVVKNVKFTPLNGFSLIVIFIVLFLPLNLSFALGTPHLIYGKVFTSEGIPTEKTNVEIYAYIPTRPDEILDQSSVGCGYDIFFDGWLWFETANCSTPWAVDENLRIIIVDTQRLETGLIDIVLDTSGSQLIPDIHLLPGDHVGPIASNAMADGASPATIKTNGFTLTALINDSLCGNNNVQRAEYFVDIDPGFGSGTAMNPEDGFFNSPQETVTAFVDTYLWSAGSTHTLYVRGQDTAGNWGTTHMLIVSVIVSQSISLVLPNGGDVIPSGGIYGICWEAPSNAVKFDLMYSINNGKSWNLIKSVTGLNCTHWEEVPVVTANKKKCRVKVIGYDSNSVKVGEDISDKPFTIEVVRVTSLNGGETLKSGDKVTIQWITNRTIRPVAKTVLKYTTNRSTWNAIKTLTGNPGSFNWKVPAASSTKCKVKVILKDESGTNIGTDTSDKVFTIQP